MEATEVEEQYAAPRRPNAPSAPAGRTSWRAIGAAVVLALVAFLAFNANQRAITAVDTFAARYLPFSILRNHSVLLNPILETVAQGRRPPSYQGRDFDATAGWIAKGEGDNQVSLYPIVLPVVIAPLYLPAIQYLDARGWDPHVLDHVARVMEKLCASAIAAASVGLLYLLLRRRAPPGVALVLTLAYAFGTTTWVISSQALWPHGLAQLLVVAAMLLLTGQRTAVRVVLLGLFCGLIAGNRPPDTVLAAMLAAYGMWWAGRQAPWLVLAGLLPAGLVLAYNLMAVGHPGGAYALFARPKNYNDNLAGGIAGLLFSPTRGLFVFSPFLLFLPVFLARVFGRPGWRALDAAIVLALLLQIVGYSLVDWRQGMSWGPRWLTDALPLMMWLLAPILKGLARPGRVVFAAACALAVAIQAVGAFRYTPTTDVALFAPGEGDRMAPMWEWRNAPFIAQLHHPSGPADLLRFVHGNIDLIEVIDVLVPDGADGERIQRLVDVAGWALADGQTPLDIVVMAEGREVVGTFAFFTRPDVVQALGVASPAGWRVRFPAEGLSPGAQRLTALTRADPGGEQRMIAARSFNLPPDTPSARHERLLARAAGMAAERLGQRQQPGGHWLTAFTSTLQYHEPRDELNTYLNAIIIDVAEPLVEVPGIPAMVARARDYLTAQIEADGLVRYHGRPDAPGIGVLGCVITPDSDDTALAWRVAPLPDRTLLPGAMETMRRFRRKDGLYQTWLAGRADYQCLDPGRDPNPADIAIQMHILMLLAQADPPEAAALCRALVARAGDEALWVYYALAPPMVLLRLADMARADCPLDIPEARLRTVVPGQERWVRMAWLLHRLRSRDADPALADDADTLLRELAARDFALLATDPPLIYHNDMTATVRRFYWSEELGYALWLRLDHERRRIGCGSGGAVRECGVE